MTPRQLTRCGDVDMFDGSLVLSFLLWLLLGFCGPVQGLDDLSSWQGGAGGGRGGHVCCNLRSMLIVSLSQKYRPYIQYMIHITVIGIYVRARPAVANKYCFKLQKSFKVFCTEDFSTWATSRMEYQKHFLFPIYILYIFVIYVYIYFYNIYTHLFIYIYT